MLTIRTSSSRCAKGEVQELLWIKDYRRGRALQCRHEQGRLKGLGPSQGRKSPVPQPVLVDSQATDLRVESLSRNSQLGGGAGGA